MSVSHSDQLRQFGYQQELRRALLVVQAGTAAVGNVCDPTYTVLTAIDKTYLGDTAVVYGGVHDRLCAAPRSGGERR